MPRENTTRRQLLRTTGVATLAGLAGCTGGDGGDGGDDADGDGDGDGGSDGGGAQTTTTAQAEMDPFIIGILQPQSGPVSKTGVAATEGYQLTAGQVNNRGGLEGRTIETLVEDTEASPDTGVQRARKLDQQDDVDLLVGCTSSAVAKAVSQFAAQQGMLFLGQPTQTPDLTHAECQKTTIKTTTNLIHLQKAKAAGVAELTPDDATRVAGVNPDYVYGHQSWEWFKEELQTHRPDVEIVSETFPAFLKGDYKKEIQATLDAEPDIVHSTLYAGDQISFMKQAKQFDFFQNIGHYTLVITMSELYSLGNEFPDGSLIGLAATTPSWPNTEEHNEWTDTYMDEYGAEPTQIAYGAGGVIRGLEEAVAAAGSTERDDIISGFEGLTYTSMKPRTHIRTADHQGILDNLLVDEIVSLSGKDRYGFAEPFRAVSKDVFEEEPTCEF